MAATAAVTISGYISNLPTGSRQIGPITATSADANGQVQHLVLASGANTVTCPVSPTTSGVVIALPSTGTSLVTLKGIAGDTGVPIGKATSFLWNWGTTNAPSSFVLDSVSAYVGVAAELTFF